MAIVKQRSVKSEHHITNALDYNANPQKALRIRSDEEILQAMLRVNADNIQYGSHATFLNCPAINTAQAFLMTRILHNQNSGVLAHQFTQSFSPEDHIDIQKAHAIGVELAQRMFPHFQVVVSTHCDKAHIHNHILVNSCDMVTGKKWCSNKATLQSIREESDRICKREMLHVIQSQGSASSSSQTSLEMMAQGKSWKMELTRLLDSAVQECRSKEEFVRYMEAHDFHVTRYTGTNITVQKEGEKKAIRLDTLAKEFGARYSKAVLETAMGYSFTEQTPMPPKEEKPKRPPARTKTSWESLTAHRFAECHGLPKRQVRHNSLERIVVPNTEAYAPRFYIRGRFSLLRLLLQLLFSDRRYQMRIHPTRTVYQFRFQPNAPKKERKFIYGTIDYQTLTESAGETFCCKIPAYQIMALTQNPLLFHARMQQDGNAVITIKATDKPRFLRMLAMNDAQRTAAETYNAEVQRAQIYKRLKDLASAKSVKLRYRVITKEQAAALQAEQQEAAFFPKGNMVNVAFLPEREEQILSIIQPVKKETPPRQRNNRIYATLKEAQRTGSDAIRYRNQITWDTIQRLEALGWTFAYFQQKDSDLYNIAYAESMAAEIQNALDMEIARRRDSDGDGIPDVLDSAPTTSSKK